MEYVAGIDEVGRGPLAGPVLACCVAMDKASLQSLVVDDSKKLTEQKRNALCATITQRSAAWGIGWCSSQEIDKMNILQATLCAMQRAFWHCKAPMHTIWVDGRDCPTLPVNCEAVVGGDASVPVIAAASIVAKVMRDRWMCAYAKRYPGYGFEQHKGYGTKAHRQAMERYGLCDLHRLSFAPCQRIAEQCSTQIALLEE